MENLDVTPSFWKGRRIFVTGHTGFKGTWLLLWLEQLGAQVTGYALPPPTQPNLFELTQAGATAHCVEADIRDATALTSAMYTADPEIVFHLAAQSLVRLSYVDPAGTFSTNVDGTLQVLECSRQLPSLRAVVVVTSDKCYEEHPDGRPYQESDPLGGHDPYSASKACAEIVTLAYRRSFFSGPGAAAVASARAGNVIGGGDWAVDRLMTDLMAAFSSGRRARLRNPRATRPWQHVLDPLCGYLLLAEKLHAEGFRHAEAWNFGPAAGSTANVGSVADRVAALWGKGASWEPDAAPQPREAPLLALDATKAGMRLGWQPQLDLEETLDWTVSWYRRRQQGMGARELVMEQIADYEDRLARAT